MSGVIVLVKKRSRGRRKQDTCGYSRYSFLCFRICIAIYFLVMIILGGRFGPGLSTVCAEGNSEIETEKGFILLNVKDINLSPFFEVMVDAEERVYLPLSKVFEQLELHLFQINWQQGFITGTIPTDNNSYYYFDFKSGQMQRQKDIMQISSEKFFVKEKEIYLYYEVLKDWLPLELHWDQLDYQIRLDPKFKLVSEVLEEQKEMRDKLLLTKQITDRVVQKSPAYLFLPGIINYRGNGSASLRGINFSAADLRYVGQLLFGDFESGISLTSEGKLQLTDWRLAYEEVAGLGRVAIGANLLNFPYLLRSPGRIAGLTLSNQDQGYKYGVTTLSGTAPPGSEVELYNRGMLVGFQEAANGIYNFSNISLQGSYNVYEIVIYAKDGRIFRDKQYVLSRDQQLKPGKSSYEGGVGLGREGVLLSAQMYYGLTERITLGGMLSSVGVPADTHKGEQTSSSGNFVGGEVIYKLSPSAFCFVDAQKPLFDEGLCYTVQLQSVLKDLTLVSALTAYHDVDVPNRDVLIIGGTPVGLSRQGTVQIEKNTQRRGFVLDYSLSQFGNKLRHQIATNFSYRINLKTGLRLQNMLKFGTDQGWGDLFIGSLSYSGWHNFDLKADTSLILMKKRVEPAMTVNLVSKQKSGTKLNYSLSLNIAPQKFNISGNMQYKLSENCMISGGIGQEGIHAAISVQETRRLNWSFKKVASTSISSGWVQGRVYLDVNGNGRWDTNEQVFSGVKILVDDYAQGVTGADGKYLVEGLPPHQVSKISIDTMTLDALYLPMRESIAVQVRPGTGMDLDLGVAPCSGISGYLLGDEDLLRELSGKVAVVLKNKGGQVAYRTPTECDGFFVMEGVLPGDYQLTLEFPEGMVKREIEPTIYEVKMPFVEMPSWIDGIEIKVK